MHIPLVRGLLLEVADQGVKFMSRQDVVGGAATLLRGGDLLL
ncbi:hypothetical protein ACWGDS_35530 [Streptomyces sp. NPDC055059]|uniref:Uncharacterized protein n=1 Tax=Streptomyces sp. NBC_00119 TaxID=2975659 RepID=A0AAU1U711_9ACTN|nr:MULTISPECIES: hypothetical protein [unclassified Streptomyces]MCX4642488.1 hypothetical protein [Streptomyces sp. NBC_01446]MCX5327429.1 hypothetical protein [Streptomyces sp. NBC_00120]